MARKNVQNADPPADARRRASLVVRRLKKVYPEVVCSLNFEDAYQLTAATILSAQCTDARVNLVTPALFAAYPTPADLAAADLSDVERLVQTTGFFREKAKNLIGMARALVDRHGGEVPRTLEEMVRLPGVGRKTANVVLGTAYGIATGVVVDTHVKRVSYRLGLTEKTDPVQIERDLIALLPKRHWIDFSHRLIFHGRDTCAARKPQCEGCVLADRCPQVGVVLQPPPPAGRKSRT